MPLIIGEKFLLKKFFLKNASEIQFLTRNHVTWFLMYYNFIWWYKPLCSEDWYKASFNFGNVNSLSPIEIYNAPEFNKIRKLHTAGKKNQVKKRKNCTAHYSVLTEENALQALLYFYRLISKYWIAWILMDLLKNITIIIHN